MTVSNKLRPAATPQSGSRAAAPAETTHFGFDQVSLESKQALVDDVFHKVAERYDLMNDVMSAGLHRMWKDVLVSMVKPSPRSLFRHLDVAGGTGDVARRVAAAGGLRTEVTVLDINPDMLRVGRDRLAETAHAFRNVPRIPLALAEAYRVLKRGGHFLCLEFSAVDVPGLDRVYDLFSFKVIPTMGRMVAGDAEPYRYLVESIRRFPGVETFSDMIADAGFRRVAVTRLTGGVVTIHSAWKL